MKHPILQLFIALSLVVLTGCTFFSSDGNSATKTDTEITTETAAETTSESEESSEMIGLSYYFHHGSMAGMDCNYTILKEPSGTYMLHAEMESGNRTVDKEISKEEFDAIAQMYIDNYATQKAAEPEDMGDEYALLDANSAYIEATFADEQIQFVDLAVVLIPLVLLNSAKKATVPGACGNNIFSLIFVSQRPLIRGREA